MAYYSCLLIYIGILYLFTGQIKNEERRRKIFFVLTCLGVVLFQGFRSFTVGTDLASYIPSYPRVGSADFSNLTYLNYEPGYVVLNKILYRLGLDQREFLIAIAVIVQVPIFYTMYRYSEQPMLSILWYFAFGNFLMTFSGLRQSIAMAVCFAGYGFIKNRKFMFYFLIILFAATFHTSALFCLFLYPFYFVNLDKKKIFIALGIFAIVYALRSPIFAFLSKLYYGEAKSTTSTGAFTMFAVFVLMFLLSFYKKNEEVDYIGLRNILFLLAMIYSFSSMHDYVTRIGYPLSLYMTVFVPKLVDSYNVKPKWLYHGICGVVLITAFYYFLGGLNTLPFSFG